MDNQMEVMRKIQLISVKECDIYEITISFDGNKQYTYSLTSEYAKEKFIRLYYKKNYRSAINILNKFKHYIGSEK